MPVLSDICRHFEPRLRVRSLDWCRTHVFTHEGRPFDHDAYPHLGAPGGPFDAFDDPKVRDIWLQWASRLGKSFFGQCCQLFTAANGPCPMMFASSVEKLAVEVVARTYRMVEQCRPLKNQLRPENRRTQDRIDLAACKIFVAWSRSVSTLADKDMRVGHANEIDKWEHLTTSKEADPLKLFDDRAKNFTSFKRIKEGTPQVKGASRVERGRLASTNCSYWVPCPHCGHYQTIVKGDEDTPHGLKWDKNEAGKSDRDLARATARYLCASCGEAIRDEHRPRMMRAGVWCPEGCTVDNREAAKVAKEGHEWRGWAYASWIVGEPARDGHDAGYQLSSLYALSLTWGDVAAEFVGCKDRPQDLRNFNNQWLGETWELVAHKQTWEQLGERIIDRNLPHAVVPSWGSLLTLAVDRQAEHYVYTVDAWGPGRASATILYGTADSLEEIEELTLGRTFEHAAGGESLRVQFGLVDSGYRPLGVYEFCAEMVKKGRNIRPCKGSSVSLDFDYKQTTLTHGSVRGTVLFHVDTFRTQAWMDKVLHVLKQGDEGATYLFNAPIGQHQDFLQQVLNDAAIIDLDRSNNDREKWERIDPATPNDYRDCRRYGYAAMLIATRGAPIRPRNAPAPTRPALVAGGGSRPDGRPWI